MQKKPIVHEVLSDEPVAIPLRFSRQSGFNEVVRQMIRSEQFARDMEKNGVETFEEADDFDVGDDVDPNSPYEEVFDPVENDLRRRLTMAEHDAEVERRLRLAQSKLGVDHGDAKSVEGRVVDGSSGSGRRDKKRKGKSGPEQNADDGGSVRQADSGDTRSDE